MRYFGPTQKWHIVQLFNSLKMAEKGDQALKELVEKAKAEKDLKEIVDTINKGDTYNVLSKEEYDNLVEIASKRSSSTHKPHLNLL